MNRRGFLALSAATLALLPVRPALAQDVVAGIVRQLERRGYRDITVSRTWLGRARILAHGPRGLREIIINPATGEILRDLTTRDGRSGAAGGDLLGGDDDSKDDDGNDDDGGDDDSGDDDHSGHGGGGSGGGEGEGDDD